MKPNLVSGSKRAVSMMPDQVLGGGAKTTDPSTSPADDIQSVNTYGVEQQQTTGGATNHMRRSLMNAPPRTSIVAQKTKEAGSEQKKLGKRKVCGGEDGDGGCLLF